MKRDRRTPARAAPDSRREGNARGARPRSRLARLIGSVLWYAAVAACNLGPDPNEPYLVRTVLHPPPEYRVWWRELEACSGVDGDFGRVTFLEVVRPLLVNGSQFPCGGGAVCNGMWETPHDISIAPGYLNNERLVKHEMLHDLIRTPGHPPVFEQCNVSWVSGSSGSTAG
jgi:hypothetical protein